MIGTQQVSVAGDTLAPAVKTSVLPIYSLGTIAFRYAATDPGSGVASYDTRYRTARYNGGYGGYGYPSSWQGSVATSRSFAPVRGSTYCFSVRARDHAGNTSPWTADRCTAAPLDDRSLIRSAGWTLASNTAFYATTISIRAAAGGALTRTGIQARRLAIVATKCRGCGTVGTYWNGTLLRQISLNATTTAYRRVINITDQGTPRSGNLVIKPLNTGRVYIDGLGLSRA